MHRLTEFSLQRPWLTLAILLAITVGLGLGVPKVKQALWLSGARWRANTRPFGIPRFSHRAEFSGGLTQFSIAWECGPGQPV